MDGFIGSPDTSLQACEHPSDLIPQAAARDQVE